MNAGPVRIYSGHGTMKQLRLRNIPLITRLLLAAFVVLAIAALVVGLDNVIGLIIGMASAAMIITEITRRWRSIRRFLFLAVGTFLTAVIISGLYVELIIPLARRIAGEGVLQTSGWQIYQEFISAGILMISPGCIVIGLGGAAVLALQRLARRLQARKDPESNLTPTIL